MEQAEFLRLYQQMVVIRHLEEKCAELYQQGKIGGFLHLLAAFCSSSATCSANPITGANLALD